MNKKEAIESIKKISDDLLEVKFVSLESVIDIVSQIHEPQKVVLPKFVAEWYDHAKQQNFTLSSALEHWSMSEELEKWFQYSYNQETFARAWLDSYEVEQEQLFTVRIPDPNRPDTVTFLYKENGKVFIGSDIFLDEVPNYKWEKEPENQLTESEIKQDFEWAWQFAKEVE